MKKYLRITMGTSTPHSAAGTSSAPFLRRSLTVCLLLLLSLFPAMREAWSQDTGQGIISGTVTDPGGASVPKATVAIRNTDTNVTIKSISNGTGYFEVRNLNAGTYEISVTVKGFDRLLRSGITLLANGHPEVPLTLKVGNVSDTVMVSGDAPLVETQDVSIGQVYTSEEMSALPNGQSAIWLAMLSPGVQSNMSQNYSLGGADISWNGPGTNFGAYGRIGGNEYSLDGAPNLAGRGEAINPSPEALAQTAVNITEFDAAVGHTYGISMVQTTRSGTNDLHGGVRFRRYDLRWFALQHFARYNLQTNLKMYNCSANPGSADCVRVKTQLGWPGTHLNYGDGGFGGPVFIPHVFDGRNKLFFFVGVDIQAPNNASSSTISLPTALEKTGDFSDLPSSTPTAVYAQACPGQPYFAQYQIYNPYSTKYDAGGIPRRDPICGNKLPAALISNLKMVQLVNSILPDPNTINPSISSGQNAATAGQNFVYVPANRNQYRAVTNRFDYAINGQNHVFFRWSRGHQDQLAQSFVSNNLGSQDVAHWVTTGTLGYSRILSPKAYVDFVVGATQWTGGGDLYPGWQSFKPSDLGLPSYVDDYAGADAQFPILSISGYQNVGQQVLAVTHYRTLAVRSNLTEVRGTHTFRAGAEWRQQNAAGGGPAINNGNPGPSGQFTFDNTYVQQNNGTDGSFPTNSTGLSYASFLMGVQHSATVSRVPSTSRSTPYYGLYLGDTWRATRRITFIPGIRYEYEWGPTEKNNRQIVGWDPNATLTFASTAQNMYQAARAKITGTPDQIALVPTSLDLRGGPIYAGVNGASTRQWNNNWRLLPRLAMAYSIRPGTVLRTGVGLYYDTLDQPSEAGTINTDGFAASTTVNASNVDGTDFQLGVSPMTNPFPSSGGSRFTTPVGSSVGADYYAGSNATIGIYDHDRKPARSWRFQLSLEHQLGRATVVQVAYVGSQTKQITLDGNMNNTHSYSSGFFTASATPSRFFSGGTQPNSAMSNFLGQRVSNPFYYQNFGALAISDPVYYNLLTKSSYTTSPTLQLFQLVHPFPQLNALRLYRSNGGSQFQEFQANLSRRMANGLVLNFAYQRNYQKDRDYFENLFDEHPSLESALWSPPWRMTASWVWNLPFGYNMKLATSGWKSAIFGGFQFAGTYEQNPGQLLTFSGNGSPGNGPNTFFIGDMSKIHMKHPLYQKTGGFVQDFNTNSVTVTQTATNGIINCSYSGSGFVSVYSPLGSPTSQPTACLPNNYNLRNFPVHIEGVRAMSVANWNMNLARRFNTGERVKTELRADLLNVFNHQRIAAPAGGQMNPNNAQFGLATSDGGNGRNMVFQLLATF